MAPFSVAARRFHERRGFTLADAKGPRDNEEDELEAI